MHRIVSLTAQERKILVRQFREGVASEALLASSCSCRLMV